MKHARRFVLWAATILLFHTAACGQIVVDGRLTGDEPYYGAALSVQNTNTHFGNATNGDARFANGGSEIDQVFATVSGGRLFVLIGGNLESNFNKLEVFIDAVPGGVNQLNGSSLPAHVDPYCCGSNPPSGALQQLSGLRFDAGFEADRYLTFSNGVHAFGNPQLQRWTLSAYYADLAGGVAGGKSEVGFQYQALGVESGLQQGEPIDQLNNGCTSPADTNCAPPEHEFAEPIDTINDPANTKGHRDFLNNVGLRMAIDNSNTVGVNAGTGAATGNPQAVVTGIEFSLPLAELGNPLGDIKLTAFINSGPHSFISNQFSGVGVLRSNLGGDMGAINLATIAGDQFVTIPHVGVAGDYNHDGVVDAADYVVWRKRHPGGSAQAEYELWRSHFGHTASGGAGEAFLPIIPEPSSLAMLLIMGALFGMSWRVRSGDIYFGATPGR
jgi:PEP-CTERM motif